MAAGNFARLDLGNAFTGNQSVTGDVSVSGNSSTAGTVTIGSGGTAIKEHLSILVNPGFPALKPGACSTANFAFTGASDGDTLALGVPNARMAGGRARTPTPGTRKGGSRRWRRWGARRSITPTTETGSA